MPKLDGTGPRGQMGLCLNDSTERLKNYKEYLESELELVNSNLKNNKK